MTVVMKVYWKCVKSLFRIKHNFSLLLENLFVWCHFHRFFVRFKLSFKVSNILKFQKKQLLPLKWINISFVIFCFYNFEVDNWSYLKIKFTIAILLSPKKNYTWKNLQFPSAKDAPNFCAYDQINLENYETLT